MSCLRIRTIAAAALATGLTACAVGPDFKPPTAPQVSDAARPYTATALPAQTAGVDGPGGTAQRFTTGADVPALWWQMFKSEPLDALIRAALAHSPTLASAQAALREAQENYDADAGNKRLPAVDGQLGATRERASQAASKVGGGAVYNLFNASVDVSYTVDAFGAVKRELEGLQAQVDLQRYQVEAAYLSLTANLVTTAIQEASLRAQLDATRAVIDAQTSALALVRKQVEFGAVAQQPVLAQQAQLAQTRATIPALEKALAQTRQQLAVYAGRLPGDDGLPEFSLDSLHLPADLPLSLPSSLVRQRPDIQAAEATLHAASAQVGVATANLYPQITLSGSLGLQSLKVGDLFNGNSLAWSLGAGLLAPIFNGGALQAKQRAAEAAYDQALAQYRQTVLNAFLNVANTLRALDSDANALQAQAEAESLARQSLDLIDRQVAAGALTQLQRLSAQQTVQQTRIALVQARAARYADTAALFTALGGGWWNRGALAAATTPPAFAASAPSASPPPTK